MSSASLASPAPPGAIPHSEELGTSEALRLRRWRIVTLGSLGVGYMGYYVCRSNLSLATPLLLEEFGPQGIDKEAIGLVVSVGVLFYAFGKVFTGILCDFLGGRRMFLAAMVASILCTVLFGAGTGLSVFLVVWSLNRLVQSIGWGSLVKITSRWFPPARYGAVMSVLSLSYLFGDAVARLFLGSLLEVGVGWRGMFYAAAGVLTVIAIVSHFLIRESPRDRGLPEPRTHGENLFGEAGDNPRPAGLSALLLPFAKSPAFWMAAGICFGLTLLREAFTFWTPTYLSEAGGMSAGNAGILSLVFPLVGGISVLLFGGLADWVRGRGILMFSALALLAPVLLMMGILPSEAVGTTARVGMISLSALLMIGPYSFLGGVIALNLGAKQGSSTAAGLIDGAGYLGSVLSGVGIGVLAEQVGWNAVFLALAGIAVATSVIAFFYWRNERAGEKRRNRDLPAQRRHSAALQPSQ